MFTRRSLLDAAGAGAIAGAFSQLFAKQAGAQAGAEDGLDLPPQLPEGTRAEAVLDALPGKKPLIKLSYRPPNYETPVEYLRSAITPNDAFFVRYHLSDIPELDGGTWRLTVGGEGARGEVRLS